RAPARPVRGRQPADRRPSSQRPRGRDAPTPPGRTGTNPSNTVLLGVDRRARLRRGRRRACRGRCGTRRQAGDRADVDVRCGCTATPRRSVPRRAGRRVKVALLGGTGDFGLALAKRLVVAGDEVVIGSRDAQRAGDAADELGARGATNEEAVGGAELVVLAVNADAALPTAQALANAIGERPLLSVASALRFMKAGVLAADEERSLAERTQELVDGPVVAGLHSLAAANLAGDEAPDQDALVCGDDDGAKALALELA